MTFTTNEGQVVEAEFNDGRTADPAGYDVGAKVTVAYLPDDPSDILPMPERELYVYEPSSGLQIEYVLPIFLVWRWSRW
ncbi:DUF3592 domain-containing protein [Ornithinimicrobium sp. INDO-MA30-4]|uniref:DUF3592 domain-containing protein n=1 Tax=Ornithinimicrobium sp. INDO-MA30-4 TaxID=2908651 RepID=UPI001F2CCCDF|nr:DUF3592 domain-containing protein [Ornithinimicrobium sp. INDO-MA30-4]UJH71265.1 DUF3592 domain-containing protein [Ornithinimicrobium sp. INDO-MA30-4]